MEFGASPGVRTNFRKVQLDAQAAAVTPMLALGPAEPTKAAATN
jgi:hypothetical protein